MMEIERKWLVSPEKIPYDLSSLSSYHIDQAYCSFSPTVRVRSVDHGEKYILTVKKPAQSDEEEPLVAVKSEPLPAPEPAPVVEQGVSPEIIAAISAAISAYGFAGQVKAVRIINHEGTPWRASAKFNNLQRK